MQTSTLLNSVMGFTSQKGLFKVNCFAALTALLFLTYSSYTYAQNTKLGTNTLINNTSGTYNTALGYYALNSNTTGSFNAAMGANSLRFNTVGVSNTANGTFALYRNTNGNGNTAAGYAALYNTTTGGYNNAAGYYAFYSNKTGSRNVAVGNKALYYSVANSSNVAVGDSALYKYNDGSFADYMVAVGKAALTSNTTGFYNTATGGHSLLKNSTGLSNTANGVFSLSANTTGSCNTAVGYGALNVNTTGSNNTAIGCNANMSSDAFTNATAIGSGAIATASNQVMLGNTAVTSVYAAGSFVIMSDGRFKDNRKANVPGLDFIQALQPVTYNYNIHRLNSFLDKDRNKVDTDSRLVNCCSAAAEEAIRQKEKKLYTGFIAQEVEAAAKKLGYDFSGVYKPQTDNEAYGLSYADFVVPLVKAVQELSKMNDEKDTKINDLQKQINELKALITASTIAATSSTQKQTAFVHELH